VTGALGGDPPAVRGGRADNLTDVVCAPRQCNAEWLLVDQDVESQTLQVPIDVFGGQQCSGHACSLNRFGETWPEIYWIA
jgi:hypothetical protein